MAVASSPGDRRQAILSVVRNLPGLHLSEIARRVQSSVALTEYHLHSLEKERLVSSLHEPHYRRFFPTAAPSSGAASLEIQRRLVAWLRNPVRFVIASTLAAHEPLRSSDLAARAGLSRPAMAYQLSRLRRHGVVRRDEAKKYWLGHPDVKMAIERCLPTSDLVNGLATLVDELRGG